MPVEICRWELRQLVVRAAARAEARAGRRMPMSRAMMAMTTRSSMSVKAGRGRWRGMVWGIPDCRPDRLQCGRGTPPAAVLKKR